MIKRKIEGIKLLEETRKLRHIKERNEYLLSFDPVLITHVGHVAGEKVRIIYDELSGKITITKADRA